jgi:hypothetical protein
MNLAYQSQPEADDCDALPTDEPLKIYAHRQHYCPTRYEIQMRSYQAAPRPDDDPSWLARKPQRPEPCAMCLAARRHTEALG